MSYDDVAGKFLENAEFAGLPAQGVKSVIEMVRDLESLASIDRLMVALARA
jgi:hypothetical protein